ncbi:MAG: NAD(P)-binding domain-containing protein [Candidatus Bathyarchaeota archaeon]|nr:NAD(P)-binding domain-containing protein [Candidatus Bathyarchaeota archaeon]
MGSTKLSSKVCVIGLGQVGFPVADYAYKKGLEVCGYDINPATAEKAMQTGGFKATTQWETIPPADVYIVCVTTSQTDQGPDLTPVFEVCKKIAQKAPSNALISIESTIIPGTSKKIYETILQKRVGLVHAPHRYWADQADKYGVNQLRVIGAVNTQSLQTGLKFYQDTLGIPMHTCNTAEVAEMCKITENSHRYLQIAFAEDLKMLCSQIGMSFEELRAACNTKWNVDIPEARDGIGRHCLPKDIKYVTSLAPSTMLQSAMQVDKQYREWLIKNQQ